MSEFMQGHKFILRDLSAPGAGALLAAGKPVKKFEPRTFREESAPAEAAPPPSPTFTEEEVQTAKQQGYQQGFTVGQKEGAQQTRTEQAEIDAQLTGVVEQLVVQIDALFDAYNAQCEEWNEILPKLALSVARKVAGKALDVNPLPLIESVVKQCMERLVGEPHIAITVHSTLSDTLEKRLLSRFNDSDKPGQISIHGDESLSPGDCRIQWDKGEAARDTQKIWSEVEGIIHSMIQASGQRETTAPHEEGIPAQVTRPEAPSVTPAAASVQTPAEPAPEQTEPSAPTPLQSAPPPSAPPAAETAEAQSPERTVADVPVVDKSIPGNLSPKSSGAPKPSTPTFSPSEEI